MNSIAYKYLVKLMQIFHYIVKLNDEELRPMINTPTNLEKFAESAYGLFHFLCKTMKSVSRTLLSEACSRLCVDNSHRTQHNHFVEAFFFSWQSRVGFLIQQKYMNCENVISNLPFISQFWNVIQMLVTLVGSSVPSAFVLWVMRELPPAQPVHKPEESGVIVFIRESRESVDVNQPQSWTTSVATSTQSGNQVPLFGFLLQLYLFLQIYFLC